jgi:recombination protein RecR
VRTGVDRLGGRLRTPARSSFRARVPHLEDPTRVYEGAVQDLIDELGRLPGVGPKSAQRIAFHLLQVDPADARRLADAITRVKAVVRFCRRCFNVSEAELCRICRDERRDGGVLCVVEEARDVVAIERTREYRGRYHVLGGAISPIDGIGPDELHIAELLTRLADEPVEEIVLATNPNVEGEATASYLSRTLADQGVRITRLASGLPVGGDLDYADEVTLGRAFAGRRELGT